MEMPSVLAALPASAPLLIVPAQGQGAPEQIERGLELYLEGEYGAAITQLGFVINDTASDEPGRYELRYRAIANQATLSRAIIDMC